MTFSKLAAIKDELRIEEKKRNQCKIGQWLETLTEDDKEIAVELINMRSISAKKLMAKFKQVGADFGTTTLKQHRIGICICSKTLETS